MRERCTPLEVKGHSSRGQSVYQAVGVDDGLVVVSLMSQNDGLMEETRSCLQLSTMHTELREHTHITAAVLVVVPLLVVPVLVLIVPVRVVPLVLVPVLQYQYSTSSTSTTVPVQYQ